MSFPKPVRETAPRVNTMRRTSMKRRGRCGRDAAWSKQVRMRDGQICQRCGKFGDEAHHVATRSRRPDLKHVLSNGATLCHDCHRWVHDNPLAAVRAGLLSEDSYELRSGVAQVEHPPNREYAETPAAGPRQMTAEEAEAFKQRVRAALVRD